MKENTSNLIFLDNASTTRISREVNDTISKANLEDFYNPSALYHQSVLVKEKLENAQREIANILKVEPKNIIFTSGATEANNLAILGSYISKKDAEYIFSSGEHPSVYNVAKFLEQKGAIVHFAKLNNDGMVDIEHLKSLLNENTYFVSIMLVSNEIGAINDIKTIAKAIKSFNSKITIHIDGVQGFCKIPCNIKEWNIDAFSVSAHKFHGPKGVGFLYYKNLNALKPQMLGGGQQNNYRSGTENISGILGMQKAIQLENEKMDENYKKVSELKQLFVDKINKELSQFDYRINGNVNTSSPYILSVSFKGLRSEVLMHMLEENGVIVGTGSACSSKKQENRVLSAIGQSSEYVKGNIRISFSSDSTKEEVEKASEIFVQTVKTLYKNMSR